MYCELGAVTSFTLVHFIPTPTCSCFDTKGFWNGMGVFIPDLLSSYHHFLARRKSSAVLTQSSTILQRWVAEGRESEWQLGIQGWKEHRKGDPRKCLAPSDLLNGFPLSGYRESGWEGSSVLPTPFGAWVRRHGHSVATRLHTPLLTVQGSK